MADDTDSATHAVTTSAGGKRLTVVHASASGGTRTLVSAFCAGAARVDAVDVVTRSASVCSEHDLRASDGLVFATPENFGYMAGEMKAMFDRLFYRMMFDRSDSGGGSNSELAGRPYVVIVCAGNDGQGALQSVDRIVTGWRMRALHPALIARRVGGEAGSSKGAISEQDLENARALGEMFATALELGVA
jgi:hypothetical protein